MFLCLSALLPLNKITDRKSSDGVAARGLVNGRGPPRSGGRDLPDRTFSV